MDAAGHIFIGDTDNRSIRREDAISGYISKIAGGSAGFSGDGGQATAATLNFPRAVMVDAGGLIYITDTGNQRIRKINGAGTSVVLIHSITGSVIVPGSNISLATLVF